jgi:hypothetical protein
VKTLKAKSASQAAKKPAAKAKPKKEKTAAPPTA